MGNYYWLLFTWEIYNIINQYYVLLIDVQLFSIILFFSSDKGNGKIAFVLNLSKFWKPQYGGILHFLDEERKNIIDSYVPDFNNLILFEVPEDHDRPHFVSHIATNIKHSRYAITGWYN